MNGSREQRPKIFVVSLMGEDISLPWDIVAQLSGLPTALLGQQQLQVQRISIVSLMAMANLSLLGAEAQRHLLTAAPGVRALRAVFR